MRVRYVTKCFGHSRNCTMYIMLTFMYHLSRLEKCKYKLTLVALPEGTSTQANVPVTNALLQTQLFPK